MAREETVILDFQIQADDSIETIESLTKANKALREERKKVDLQSAEGQKQIQAINTKLDANNQKIKENVSALEKQKINIGNYKSELDGIDPALGRVSEGLQAGTSGLKAMVLQAKAFLLTGIGAAIAALVTVFVLLKTALSQNDALMDKFENITNAVGVVVEVVTARIGKLGEALIALSQGNFSEAVDLTAAAFSGLADEIANAVTQQQLFLDASRDLEDSQRSLRIETARQENEIRRLVVAAKNRNLTFDEQESLLRKALALEEKLVDTREDIARRDLVITARRLRADKEFQQTSEETFDQYIERLLNSSKLAPDELDKIAEKIEAVESARGSSLAFQEKLENSLAAIQEKRAAALEKQNKALLEQAEIDAIIEGFNKRNAEREESDGFKNLEKDLVKQKDLNKDYTSVMKVQLAERSKLVEDYWKKRNSDAQKSADIEEELERRKFQIYSQLLSAGQSLVAEDSEAHKVLASAQALINTYLAATAAYASGAEINPLFGALAAAAAVTAGLANVAKINGVEFAEGGWTGPGSKYQVAGVVHADEYVVPKKVVNSPSAQYHLQSLERMRGGYYDGGYTTSSVSNPVNQQLEIMNLVKNMPAPEVSVKEVTKYQKRVKVKEQISKR